LNLRDAMADTTAFNYLNGLLQQKPLPLRLCGLA